MSQEINSSNLNHKQRLIARKEVNISFICSNKQSLEEKKENARAKEFDIAKGIGILIVVYNHIFQGNPLILFTSSFNMPLFFFITGYFLKIDISPRLFTKKKFKEYIIPYLSFSLILCFFKCYIRFLHHDKYIYKLFKDELLKYLLAKRINNIWFLPALTIAIFIYYIVYLLVRRNRAIHLFIIFTLGSVGYYISKGIQIKKFTPLYGDMDISLIILVYLLLGNSFKKYNIISKYFNTTLKKEISCIFFSFISYSLTKYNISLKYKRERWFANEHGFFPLTFPAGILMSVSVIWLSFILIKIKFFGYILEHLGKNSLCIMAFHNNIGITLANKFLIDPGKYYFVELKKKLIYKNAQFALSLGFSLLINHYLSLTRFKFILGK